MNLFARSNLEAEIFNDGTKDGDVLNFGCGADFVKVCYLYSNYSQQIFIVF